MEVHFHNLYNPLRLFGGRGSEITHPPIVFREKKISHGSYLEIGSRGYNMFNIKLLRLPFSIYQRLPRVEVGTFLEVRGVGKSLESKPSPDHCPPHSGVFFTRCGISGRRGPLGGSESGARAAVHAAKGLTRSALPARRAARFSCQYRAGIRYASPAVAEGG